MKSNRTIRISLSAVGSLIAVLILHLQAAAQCAMCKNAITGSPNAAKLAANFNFAILVLLIPPVLIFCGIFFAVFKLRKTNGEESFGEHQIRKSLRTRMGKLRFTSRAWNLSAPATDPSINKDKL